MNQKIFVIDDEHEVCDAIRWLFSTMDIEVCCYTSSEDFLESYQDELGCLILDVRMKGMSGTKLQEKLNERHCNLPLIFITGHGDVQMAVNAMKAGAVDFLTKPFNNQHLIDVVHTALEENLAEDKRRRAKQEILSRIDTLTAREKEVLVEISTGKLNKIVADDLGISPHTVELHRAKIMKKMKVKTLGELINCLLNNGIRLSQQGCASHSFA